MFSLSLPLVLGFVVVLIDDCLPGLSEFKAVDYWRVDYWCVSGTVEYWYSIPTGSETYSSRQWVVSRGGSGIENDEFVFVVCVVFEFTVIYNFSINDSCAQRFLFNKIFFVLFFYKAEVFIFYNKTICKFLF